MNNSIVDESVKLGAHFTSIKSAVSNRCIRFMSGILDSLVLDKCRKIKGIGLLRGSHCSYYNSEQKRPSAYRQLVEDNMLSAGVAADDGVALRYIGDKLETVVS